jgi:hypothetical protein
VVREHDRAVGPVFAIEANVLDLSAIIKRRNFLIITYGDSSESCRKLRSDKRFIIT